MGDLIEGILSLAGKHKSEHSQWFAANRRALLNALKAGQRCADELESPAQFRDENDAAEKFWQALNGRRFACATGVEALVSEDLAERQRKGKQKYGVSVIDNPLPLREWLQHAYEECLDQAIYLKRAMREMDLENAELCHGSEPLAAASGSPSNDKPSTKNQ